MISQKNDMDMNIEKKVHVQQGQPAWSIWLSSSAEVKPPKLRELQSVSTYMGAVLSVRYSVYLLWYSDSLDKGGRTRTTTWMFAEASTLVVLRVATTLPFVTALRLGDFTLRSRLLFTIVPCKHRPLYLPPHICKQHNLYHLDKQLSDAK